jgi:cyclohexanone monooxygenase
MLHGCASRAELPDLRGRNRRRRHWYWNRYPGARVDIESQEYSYPSRRSSTPSGCGAERYASQPELLTYLNHVADRFDLRPDIQFETRVTAAHFDRGDQPLEPHLDRGETVTARYCVMATGCLSVANEPAFPEGPTVQGPHVAPASGPRKAWTSPADVAVIGTGSSAIQSIPQIAARPTTSPSSSARPTSTSRPTTAHPTEGGRRLGRQPRAVPQGGPRLRIRAQDGGRRRLATFDATEAERKAEYERRWAIGGFALLALQRPDHGPGRQRRRPPSSSARRSAASSRTPRPEKLTPKTYPIGSKRICVDTGYYATFNRDNVSLVDLTRGADRGDHARRRETAAREYAADAIVYAIGFDAMTGALSRSTSAGAAARR